MAGASSGFTAMEVGFPECSGELGLRPGEVSGLQWGDVDLDRRVVIVHQALAWNGNDPYLKTTKTKRPRTLEMLPMAIDALRNHRKNQIEERLLMGDRWPAEWSDLCLSVRGEGCVDRLLRRSIEKLTPAERSSAATCRR